MPETSARSKLKVEIGSDVAQAEMGLRVLMKSLEDFRKTAENVGKVSIFGSPAALKAQVQAGIKPLIDLRRQLAETMRDAKAGLATATDPKDIERLQIIQAQATRASQQLVQSMRQLKVEANSKTKDSFIETLSLQAKAGLIPLSRLRDELVRTLRESIGAKTNRADFIDDQEILRDIVRLKQLNTEIDRIRRDSQQPVKNPFAGLGQALQQALLPLAGITAGLTLALQQAGGAAHEFDGQLRQISTITKQSTPELAALGDQLEEAADNLQTNPVDLAAADYEILSSGIEDTSKAFDVMTVSAKLAKAGVGTAAESADILTSSLNALGGTPTRNAEILFKAVDLGKVAISELSDEFGGVAAQAATSGVSLEEISASVATLSLTGRNAAEGLTGIRAILTAVSKQAPDAVKFAKSIGLEFNTAAIRAKGFAGFIADVAEKTKGSDEAIAKLFGRVEGINTILSLGTVQADQYARVLDEVKNSTGSLEEAFQRTLNPIDGFRIALQNIAIEVGEKLTNALAKPLGLLTDFLAAIREQKDLLAFATGATAIAVGLGALATAASAVAFVIGPLIPLLQGLASILAGGTFAAGVGAAAGSIALGPAIFTVIGAFVALAATGGILTTWANRISESAKFTSKSVAQMNSEIDQSTNAIITESREAIKTAKSFDELAKKANKTQAEKEKLKQTIIELHKQFPGLEGDIDKLTSGYASLTDQIVLATAAKIAFAESQNIEKELESIQKQKDNILGSSKFLGATIGGDQSLSEKEIEDLQSLDKRQEALLKRKADIQVNTAKKIKEIFKPAANQTDKNTNTGLDIPDASEINNVKNAKEQLKKMEDKIDEERTAFEKGEFAKRRLEAQHNFDELKRQIEETAKTARQSGAPEVIKAINDANKNYQAALQQINREEAQFLVERKRTIQTLGNEIAVLQAQVTEFNPFDDIAVSAQQAQQKIDNDLVEGINRAREAFNRLHDQGVFDQEVARLKQRAEVEKVIAKQAENDKISEAKRLQTQLNNDIIVLRQELSGQEFQIARATNARIIEDFDVQIEQALIKLNDAKKLLQRHPSEITTVNATAAEQALEKLRLEREKAVQKQAQDDAQIATKRQEEVVEAIQAEISARGETQERLIRLREEMEKLIPLYQMEADLAGTTETRRAELTALMKDASQQAGQATVRSSRLFKVFQSFSKISLPGGQFDDFFQTVGTGLTDLLEKFESFKRAGEGETFGDFFAANVKSVVGAGLNAVGLLGSSIQQQTGRVNQIGRGIGQAVGGLFTAVTGIPFLDTIGGFIGGLFGSGNKKAEEAQKRLEQTQSFTQQILAQADSNNLQNLQKNLQAVLKYKSGGGQAFQVKKQAADQLRTAIKNRKQVIDDALKQLGLQNNAIQLQLNVFKDQPLQALDIDRQIKLQELQAETQKALDDFKDSLAVQQQIQQNFELQRQLLLKTSAEDIIQTVIEEQNTIRELRAQELVDRARASDDAIGLINATLQQQLVAIDNEVAAFQGAEEQKTAFLAAKAAERDRIIKDSQKQLDSLLQQGLDILNEGLVVGETKFDSQQKRLKDLFGSSSLNPLGLIQASGDLLQKSITIASGAINFTMQGVQDLQSIIDQLNTNPALQAKFMDALNQLVLRAT